MDKTILDLINDFSQWKGNSFTLAALIVERQKEVDRQKLIDAGFPEAAEVL
jgi:DNA-binding SARP family transcriptional activator